MTPIAFRMPVTATRGAGGAQAFYVGIARRHAPGALRAVVFGGGGAPRAEGWTSGGGRRAGGDDSGDDGEAFLLQVLLGHDARDHADDREDVEMRRRSPRVLFIACGATLLLLLGDGRPYVQQDYQKLRAPAARRVRSTS